MESFSYKRNTLDEGQFTLLSGPKHEVELVPGDLDLWVQWYCSHALTVWLYFQSGMRLPYSVASAGSFNVRVRDILSVVLETDKEATVCVGVSYKELAIADKLDYTPVEITPPRAAQLDLSSMLTSEVKRQLAAMGYIKPGDTLEVDDEDNLEEDDDDDFGEGYMEEEQPVPLPKRGKSGASKGAPPPSDPDKSDSPAEPGGADGDSKPVK